MRAPPRRSNAPSLLLLVAFAAIHLLVVPSFLPHNNAVEAATVRPTADEHLAETLSTHTHARRTPKTVGEAIHMHCGEVLRVLENKWLPTARTDPVTRDVMVHIGFLGDSLCYHQYLFTVDDLRTCIPAWWRADLSRVKTKATGVSPWGRAIFTCSGNCTVAQGSTHPATPHEPIAGDRGRTRIVVSFSRVRYAVQVATILQQVYQRGRGRGRWPSWGDGPLPQVLFVGVGVWDANFPRKHWDGYDTTWWNHLETTENRRPWPATMAHFDALLEKRFTTPMRKTIALWQQESMRREEQPRRPSPDYFVLSTTPMYDCSAHLFNARRGKAHPKYRHLQGIERCSALLLPPWGILRHHFSQAVLSEAAPPVAVAKREGSTDGAVPIRARRTQVMAVDGSDALDVCPLDDGVHIDARKPQCRGRLVQLFWGRF